MSFKTKKLILNDLNLSISFSVANVPTRVEQMIKSMMKVPAHSAMTIWVKAPKPEGIRDSRRKELGGRAHRIF